MNTAVRRKYNLISRLYDHIWPTYIKKTIGAAIKPLTLNGSETILDVGCGTGELEKALIQKHPGLNIVGIDLSDDMLEIARKKLGNYPNILFKQGDFLSGDFREGIFDIAFSISNLHYFSNPEATFQKVNRLLKNGGRFVIIDWNRDTFRGKFYNWYMSRGDPAFAKVYTTQEASEMLANHGFKVESLYDFRVGLLWHMMRLVSKKS